MKAQEIRQRIGGKLDPDVMFVLEAMAEKQSVQKQQLTELALQFDRLATMISDVMTIAGNMKGALDQMKSIEGDEVDGPTN